MPKIPGTMHEPWSNSAAFYRELSPELQDHGMSVEALAGLCERIDASHLREGLYGHTSMRDLRICQGRNVAYDEPTVQWLVISPLADGTLDVWLEHGFRDQNWRRKVAAGDLIACFDKFLRQLGWNYHPIDERSDH